MTSTLLVAATGGHLEQLARISQRFQPPSDYVEWVTHADSQSDSLLRGETVHAVPYVPPRGAREVAGLLRPAHKILGAGQFDRVVSTGAAIAVPFFLAGRLRGVPCHYIESAARAEGPSLTGNLMAHVPGVRLYSQYRAWSAGRWNYRGSLFDDFAVLDVEARPIRSVVVTLGTMRTFEFRRLVDCLRRVLPEVMAADARVLWQTGVTRATGLPGEVRATVPNAELRDAVAAADLVVAHAGIGSALTALELGKRPVLVPRRPEHEEHVDAHQALIAGELSRRDLAVSCEADSVTAADLMRAARGRIVASAKHPTFELV